MPLIYKIDKDRPFRLAAKYPVTLDPTRRIEVVQETVIIVARIRPVYHTSFVRAQRAQANTHSLTLSLRTPATV